MNAELTQEIVFPVGFESNICSVSRLFSEYEKVGFLYKEKKELLLPFFDRIKKNWETLSEKDKDLLWILTNKDQKNFASICVIRHSNYGLLAQHLISDGNPVLSLKLMYFAQCIAEDGYDESQVKSAQNWFRPSNRYAFKVFASMYKKLGIDKASLISFEYLFYNLENIQSKENSAYKTIEVNGIDLDLIYFVREQYGDVFVKGEELIYDDVECHEIGSRFEKVGLQRSRKIIKVVDIKTNRTIGAVIANRAPIGLNFSFLENRAYFIIDTSLKKEERYNVIRELSHKVKSYYADFELGSIPIVTDKETSSCLQELGADYLRTYMQSIWIREGFAQWRMHIDSFLQRIKRR